MAFWIKIFPQLNDLKKLLANPLKNLNKKFLLDPVFFLPLKIF